MWLPKSTDNIGLQQKKPVLHGLGHLHLEFPFGSRKCWRRDTGSTFGGCQGDSERTGNSSDKERLKMFGPLHLESREAIETRRGWAPTLGSHHTDGKSDWVLASKSMPRVRPCREPGSRSTFRHLSTVSVAGGKTTPEGN